MNKAYDGIEELQPLDPEDAVETSIVTIDEMEKLRHRIILHQR